MSKVKVLNLNTSQPNSMFLRVPSWESNKKFVLNFSIETEMVIVTPLGFWSIILIRLNWNIWYLARHSWPPKACSWHRRGMSFIFPYILFSCWYRALRKDWAIQFWSRPHLGAESTFMAPPWMGGANHTLPRCLPLTLSRLNSRTSWLQVFFIFQSREPYIGLLHRF